MQRVEGEKEGEATSIFTDKIMEPYLTSERALVENGADDGSNEA